MQLTELTYDIHDYLANDEVEKIATVLAGLSPSAKNYDPYNVKDLANSDYSVIIDDGRMQMKKFAHSTPELTEINMAVLAATMNRLPKEIVKTAAQNLTRAARDFGLEIPKELAIYDAPEFTYNKIKTKDIDGKDYSYKLAQFEEETRWALPSRKMYPISNPTQINQAQEWFDKNANYMESNVALEFSYNLNREARAQGVDLHSRQLKKFANLLPNFSPELGDQIQIRKSYLTPDQTEFEQVYDEFKEKVAELEVDSAISVLESIDRRAGLNRVWGRGIAHPLESVLQTKSAEVDFSGVSKDQLLQVVDSYTASELQSPEGVAVFESLPLPVKRELTALL